MTELPNPYAPPKAEEPKGEVEVAELVDASLGRRLANFIVDYLARGVLGLALGRVIAEVGIPVHEYAVVFTIAFTLFTYMLYYVAFEAIFGFTIGKMVTGTRVVTVDGHRPTFLQILGRTAARFVPIEPFSIFGSTLCGWHDRWSGTRVVRLAKIL
jgi:uncharacterized RDD family membrane protein YckC